MNHIRGRGEVGYMKIKYGFVGLLTLVLSACATNGQQTLHEVNADDPWQSYNRHIFQFNEQVDKYIAKPIAKGYKAITPDVVEESVSNVFNNIGTVGTIANELLQLKGGQAAFDSGRLLMNSTVGVLGIFDVASKVGFEKHDEDFGQTLGYWGVESGPYFVLPFLGPSTVRDAVSLVPDNAIDPVANWNEVRERNSATALRLIDTRANLLEAEKVISGDRYLFIRDAYLQHREYLVKDGEVEDSFGDDY
jgi:phospholipid-binding lipoprotein MlaA